MDVFQSLAKKKSLPKFVEMVGMQFSRVSQNYAN